MTFRSLHFDLKRQRSASWTFPFIQTSQMNVFQRNFGWFKTPFSHSSSIVVRYGYASWVNDAQVLFLFLHVMNLLLLSISNYPKINRYCDDPLESNVQGCISLFYFSIVLQKLLILSCLSIDCVWNRKKLISFQAKLKCCNDFFRSSW